MIERFPNEIGTPGAILGVLKDERMKWLSLTRKAKDFVRMEKAINSLDDQPIWIGFMGALVA